MNHKYEIQHRPDCAQWHYGMTCTCAIERNITEAKAQVDAALAGAEPASKPESDCTEPDRKNCPRHCIVYCNEAETRKADTAQVLPPLPKNTNWKTGNEYAPFHPSASHVRPDYRDGWNDCYRAAQGEREEWREVWHGSEPYKGWNITGPETDIHLGEGVKSNAVRAIVTAHNKAAALTRPNGRDERDPSKNLSGKDRS